MSMAIVEGFPVETSESEIEMVRRAKEHEPAGWAQWHDRYYPAIYRYAVARLRNHEDAQDVASQTFIEAMKGIQGYRDRGRPILAWFYGIARHLVSRRFREVKRSANSFSPALDQ